MPRILSDYNLFTKNDSAHPIVYMFDLDGTLVNSEPLIARALMTVLQHEKFNIDLPYETAYDYVCGHADHYVFDVLQKNHGVQEENRDFFLQIFKYHIIKNISAVKAEDWFITPTVDLLKSLVAEKQKVCIVSGSSCDVIKLALKKMDLENDVPYIGCENYKKSKPDPEPYLLAARKLFKLNPTNFNRVIIFEDSLAGVEAGVAANMHVIGLQASSTKKMLTAAGAHYVLVQDVIDPKNKEEKNTFSLKKWLENYLHSPCYLEFVDNYKKELGALTAASTPTSRL